MMRRFCDLCGEEILYNESYKSFVISSDENPKGPVDMHSSCYAALLHKIRRCIDGDKIQRPKKL